jgi:DNA-binding HxlR family transcriptional regulator
MELSIHTEIAFVKDVFEGKMWYTLVMDTTNPLVTTEQTVSCDSHSTRAMERAMCLLGDKWTLMLVYNLMSSPRRFGELLKAMGNVSPKTVSQRLKMLEEKKFVDRQAFAEIPPRVEYRLTEKGLALADIMETIHQFAEQYLSEDETVSPSEPCA